MSQTAEELVIESLEPVVVPVTLGKEKVRYVLKEADENASIKFRNAQSRSLQYGPDGQVARVENGAETRSLLLSLCLFRVSETKDGKEVHTPVDIAVIRRWPNKVINALFDKAVAISGFTADETEEDLAKQIASLQERIEKMRENPSKNWQASSPDTSTSAGD